mmetsp:Transcript_61739/g.116685  ORF Transcript_61739/g.116685 Transcript_61739/m.116685 type:complete len:135 (+) Transcript_61739:3-407(+)
MICSIKEGTGDGTALATFRKRGGGWRGGGKQEAALLTSIVSAGAVGVLGLAGALTSTCDLGRNGGGGRMASRCDDLLRYPRACEHCPDGDGGVGGTCLCLGESMRRGGKTELLVEIGATISQALGYERHKIDGA